MFCFTMFTIRKQFAVVWHIVYYEARMTWLNNTPFNNKSVCKWQVHENCVLNFALWNVLWLVRLRYAEVLFMEVSDNYWLILYLERDACASQREKSAIVAYRYCSHQENLFALLKFNQTPIYKRRQKGKQAPFTTPSQAIYLRFLELINMQHRSRRKMTLHCFFTFDWVLVSLTTKYRIYTTHYNYITALLILAFSTRITIDFHRKMEEI